MSGNNVFSINTLDKAPEQFMFNKSEGRAISGKFWSVGEHSRTVIVAHGLGATQNQDQIKQTAREFVCQGCNVITFDGGNSFGESYGKIDDITLTQYSEDLKDIIIFSNKAFGFVHAPLVCGFSLGASAALALELKNPRLISSILAFAPVVSGNAWLESLKNYRPGSFEIYERTGLLSKYDELSQTTGYIKRQFIEDLLQYDFICNAEKIHIPVYIVVGENDQTCPVSFAQDLKKALGSKARFEKLNGLAHTARSASELIILQKFIRRLIAPHKKRKPVWPELQFSQSR